MSRSQQHEREARIRSIAAQIAEGAYESRRLQQDIAELLLDSDAFWQKPERQKRKKPPPPSSSK